MLLSALIILCLLSKAGAQISGSDAYEIIYSMFNPGSEDPNIGLTSFLSTMVPMGGSAESMGMAYTAVVSDASFLELNPAGSAVLKNSQFAFFHNNWIADTRVESLVYTMRLGNLGFSVGGKWLYLPFTEYDDFGSRMATGYYSEAIAIANTAIHLFPGYYFYGLAIGANLKLAYRAMPDYTDDAGNIIAGSGMDQSAMAVMADFGLLTRFNFLKAYSSREKNSSFGLTIKNVGFPSKGEPLKTVASAGFSYNFFKPIMISGDINFPINLDEPAKSSRLYWGLGYSMSISDFWKLTAGFLLKGGNPRLSFGSSFDFAPLSLDMNYTLDMTTQLAPLHRMSITARFDLGDGGRADKAARAEELYLQGLTVYAEGELELAIVYWNEALKLNPYFDPAKESRETALTALELRHTIEQLQRLEP